MKEPRVLGSGGGRGQHPGAPITAERLGVGPVAGSLEPLLRIQMPPRLGCGLAWPGVAKSSLGDSKVPPGGRGCSGRLARTVTPPGPEPGWPAAGARAPGFEWPRSRCPERQAPRRPPRPCPSSPPPRRGRPCFPHPGLRSQQPGDQTGQDCAFRFLRKICKTRSDFQLVQTVPAFVFMWHFLLGPLGWLLPETQQHTPPTHTGLFRTTARGSG